MIVEVYIGETKLDLFQSEQIEIVQSITDVRDISKVTTDYSKSFVVPASKINNKAFKHYYYVGINNSFDARIKAKGRIDLGGSLFKEGYFLLNSVVIKEGNAFSYDITFFGSLTGLVSKFADKLIGDLDIHGNNQAPYENVTAYIPLTVKNNLTLYTAATNNIIYSMFSHKELIYSSGLTGTTNTETQINIAKSAAGNSGMDWKEFYPSVKVSRIIEAIQRQFGIEFIPMQVQTEPTERFLYSLDYTNLYMLLLNPNLVQTGGDVTNEKNQLTERVDIQTIGTPGGAEWIDLTTDIITVTSEDRGNNRFDEFSLELKVEPFSNSIEVDYTITRFINKNNTSFVKQTDVQGTGFLFENSNYPRSEAGTYQIYWEIKAAKGFHFSTEIKLNHHWRNGLLNPSHDDLYRASTDDQTLGGGFDPTPQNLVVINTLVPAIKVVDFMKGLMTLFNLTLNYSYTNNGIDYYYLETLDNYYRDLGRTYLHTEYIKDFSKYADVSDYTISKLEATKEFLFKFQDPQTKLNIDFKTVAGKGYGDYLKGIYATPPNNTTNEGIQIEGKRTVIEVPFEQVLYNRIPITTFADNFGIDLQVGGLYDTSFSPVAPKPHFHYNVVSQFNDFGFIGETVKELLPPTINMPHYSLSKTVSNPAEPAYQHAVLLFEKEGSTYDITGLSASTAPKPLFRNSLYSNYYENYIESITNEKVRLVQMRMRLPMKEILSLRMSMIIKVGANHYRINKVSTNLSTGISALELVTIV
jgi:hypothetical protein